MRTGCVNYPTEGPYMRSGCHRSHRGSSRGIGQISAIRRTYGSHSLQGGQQGKGAFTRSSSWLANAQFRQPQPTGSAAAPQEPQRRFQRHRWSVYRLSHKKPSEAILMRSAGYSGNFFGNGNGSGNGKYMIAFSHGSSVAFVML